MEPVGSLPHSQEPSTGLNPKLDESSPYYASYLSKIHLNIIHQPTSYDFLVASSFRLSS
jgi:hypothetical protein